MCRNCNYPEMLVSAGLRPTPNRLKVFELIGNHHKPLSARDVYAAIRRTDAINRVTVYRILDLLVEKGLVEKMSSKGRSFHFGLAPNQNHRPHPHFYCRRCGVLECLLPESLAVDTRLLENLYPGRIENVEIRVDGVCKTCVGRGA